MVLTLENPYTPGKKNWKPIRGPMKTTVPLKGVYMGFHVSLGECKHFPFLIPKNAVVSMVLPAEP